MAGSCVQRNLLVALMAFVCGTSEPTMAVSFQEDGSDGKDGASSCSRDCIEGAERRLCYYRFVLEQYHTMGAACGNCPLNVTACRNPQCVTADGFERGILTVNRKLPGPSIQVCQGDRVVVDVENLMPGRSTTIHWHGVLQNGSPHMDGVPMVTQCPVNEGAVFRYDFMGMNAGTHFWHSHDGLQKMDGIMGSLVVRQPRSLDANSHLYDLDLPSHVMVIADWLHLDADQKFPGFRRREVGQNADAYLINGRGRFTPVKKAPSLPLLLPPLVPTQSRTLELVLQTPLALFRVRRGLRYRLRVVGATCLVCPVRLSIERHRLMVIAADGSAVTPAHVHSAVIFPGERYDFVLEADQNIRSYWIHVQGIGPCVLEGSHQVAVLKYFGSRRTAPYSPRPGYKGYFQKGIVLNPENAACGPKHSAICVHQLASAVPVNLAPEPDVRLTLGFGFHFFSVDELFRSNDYHRFFQPPLPILVSGTINNISHTPPSAPLLSQREDVPQHLFCPEGGLGVPQCPGGFCECVHVVRVPLGVVVEFILIDESPIPGGLNHPFHLHGFHFWVLDVGEFQPFATSQKPPWEGHIGRRLMAPVAKDTIAVPASGYAVIRFKADNPGLWLFHCHFLYHQVNGMGLVLQVGDVEDMPATPADFPKCGDFLPPL